MNMLGFYSLITIGAMVFYLTLVLFFFMYALMIRLVPTPVRILSAIRSRQRTFPWPR